MTLDSLKMTALYLLEKDPMHLVDFIHQYLEDIEDLRITAVNIVPSSYNRMSNIVVTFMTNSHSVDFVGVELLDSIEFPTIVKVAKLVAERILERIEG